MSGAVARRRVTLGEIGENLACRELERLGYAILARRYRRRGGEIDIVCRDGGTVVFVEVKTRDGEAFGTGSEAVTRVKRRRIVSVATDFLARHGLHAVPCRFDVVSVMVGEQGPSIDVYRGAFDADG